MLLASFFTKLFFIVVEVSLAVAFGATEYTGLYNISAILEWIVALVYIFCESIYSSHDPLIVMKTNMRNL